MTTSTAEAPARRVAIVGLGVVGRAVGTGLIQVRTNYRVVGHDREAARVKAALKAGAVDEGEWNLAELVATADLVVLSEPLDELLATLGHIAPHLQPGCLVTSTASVMVPVLRAAEQHLPDGVSFIGGHPVLRPAVSPDALPLAGATYCLVPLPSASAVAVQVMARLVEAVGAQPYFVEAAEHDALVAGVVGLPELVAGSLLALVERSPSARDLWRLAGPALCSFPVASAETGAAWRAELLHNEAAVLAWLDQALAALGDARAAVARGDGPALEALFALSRTARQHLLAPPPETDHESMVHRELKDINPLRDLFSFGRRKRTDP